MAFNIFSLFVYIANNLNASFDFVQGERFIRERRVSWRRKKAENKHDAAFEIQEPPISDSLNPKMGNKNFLIQFGEDINWVLEYNQMNAIHLIIVVSHVLILFEQVFVSIAYSASPWARDPRTHQYEDPTLDFLESLMLINFFENFNRGRILNRLLALIWFQYLLLRVRSLYKRVQNAKINRHQYERVNIVQVNMAYASELRTNLNGWLRFLFEVDQHKCKTGLSLETGQGKMMKKLSSRLKKFHKIDCLYYFNQIEFDNCFAKHHIFKSSLERTGRSSAKTSGQLGQIEEPNRYRGILRDSGRKSNVSSLVEEADHRRAYLPKPMHRVDPAHLRKLAVVYVLTTIMVITVLCTTIGAMVAKDLSCNLDSSRQESYVQSAGWFSLKSIPLQPKLLAKTASGLLIICVLAINAYDNSLMAYSSMLCYSRSRKVIKMLERENNFHRKLLEGFCRFLDRAGVDLDEVDRIEDAGSDDNGEKDDDDGDEDGDDDYYYDYSDKYDLQSKNLDLETNLLKEYSLRRLSAASANKLIVNNKCKQHADYYSNSHITRIRVYDRYTPSGKSSEPNHLKYGNYASAFKNAVAAYRAELNIEKSLREFNDNINYLMDLVGVLQSELGDMKEYFTTFINLNILFGIVTSSIAIDLLLSSTTIPDLVIHVNASIITIAPLVYAMFMGATSESSLPVATKFRQIYRALIPSMINQLSFVEPDVVRRLQKLCGHLAIKENRSFVVLGTFPLTFGSVVSILAWIFTGNLLLQRFFTE